MFTFWAAIMIIIDQWKLTKMMQHKENQQRTKRIFYCYPANFFIKS